MGRGDLRSFLGFFGGLLFDDRLLLGDLRDAFELLRRVAGIALLLDFLIERVEPLVDGFRDDASDDGIRALLDELAQPGSPG